MKKIFVLFFTVFLLFSCSDNNKEEFSEKDNKSTIEKSVKKEKIKEQNIENKETIKEKEKLDKIINNENIEENYEDKDIDELTKDFDNDLEQTIEEILNSGN